MQAVIEFLLTYFSVDLVAMAEAAALTLILVQFFKPKDTEATWKIFGRTYKPGDVLAVAFGVVTGVYGQAGLLVADGFTVAEYATILIAGIGAWLTAAGFYKLPFISKRK